jgi:hypothetical protein
VPLRGERAEPLVEPVRIAPRELRARADPEPLEVAEGGLADIREGGERAWSHEVASTA